MPPSRAPANLNLSPTLRRSLVTTNPIESMFDTVRDVSKRVTRWPTGTMALRWALAGVREADKSVRRLMGKNEMPTLMAALRARDVALAPPQMQRGPPCSEPLLRSRHAGRAGGGCDLAP